MTFQSAPLDDHGGLDVAVHGAGAQIGHQDRDWGGHPIPPGSGGQGRRFMSCSHCQELCQLAVLVSDLLFTHVQPIRSPLAC